MLSLIFLSLVLLFSSAAHSAHADEHTTLKGKVLDNKSKPIPYVSICFKNHPDIGSVSDDKGLFLVESGPETASDTLIISMLGYETLYAPAGDFLRSGVTTFRMKEYYYTIDEVLVKASRNNRRQRRSEASAILQRVYDRLISTDAPKDGDQFPIASDIVVLHDSTLVTADHLTGTLKVLHEEKSDGKDSIAVDITSYSNYLDSSVRAAIDKFDTLHVKQKEKNNSKKDHKKQWDKSTPHKAVWIINDARTVLKQIYDDPGHWVITDTGDGTTILTYRKKKGFVGIITAVMKTALTIDTGTCAVKSMINDITVNLNLPFGYRLSPDELDILNTVNLTENDVNKFKIKKAEVHLSSIAINREQGERMIPSEKSMKNSVRISDRKDKSICLDNICTMRIVR